MEDKLLAEFEIENKSTMEVIHTQSLDLAYNNMQMKKSMKMQVLLYKLCCRGQNYSML